MSEIRVVHARGDGFSRGMQVGAELQDLIQDSICLLPPVPRPTWRVVGAAPGPPHALPAGGGNRLPGHDERPQRACRSRRSFPSSSCSRSTPSKSSSPSWSLRKARLLFLQKKEGTRSVPRRPRSMLEHLGPNTGRGTHAGAQRALARRRCRQRRRRRGPPGGRACRGREPHGRLLPAGGRRQRARAPRRGSARSPPPTTGSACPGSWSRGSSLEAVEGPSGRDGQRRDAGRLATVMSSRFADGDCFTLETSGREHRLVDGAAPHTNHYRSDLAELAPEPSEGSRRAVAAAPGARGGGTADLRRGHDDDHARPQLGAAVDLPAS